MSASPREPGLDRTFLFVPGTRVDRFERACASGADMIVFDLEDAVAPADKDRARTAVVPLLSSGYRDGLRVAVRVNALETDLGRRDVAALAALDVPVTVMVPKAEADVIQWLSGQMPRGTSVLPLIETARGVLTAAAIGGAPGVHRLALGHLDLAAELGIDPGDVDSLWPARWSLLLASAANGLPAPIDGVTTEFRSLDAVRRDATRSIRTGFGGKLCIHPAQVDPVHQAFMPTPEEIEWADKVLSAAGDQGLGQVDGSMVDRPVLLRAQAVLSRAAGRHNP